MPDIPGVGDILMPNESRRIREADASRTSQIDRMPRLDAAATPSKFDRFVYDEAGIFGPTFRDKLQDLAYRFAAAANVEIVTIVAKDLQGRSADQYALDAMRQLRVGKLEVGNGAVLVVAPETGDTGVALGSGLLVQYDTVEPLRAYLQSYLKLVAVEATLVSKTPDMGDSTLGINEPMTRHAGPAMHVRTADGRDAVLYVNPNVPALMPVGLEQGRRYRFTARNSLLVQDTPQLDLISYDLLD